MTLTLTLDYALTRWASASVHRERTAPGSAPVLGPFLAGWFMRDMGAQQPTMADLGHFCDSFRAGWAEADAAIRIAMRNEPHDFARGKDDCCVLCGLATRADCHRWPV